MRRLEGKVAIVTGGAGGIGSATCRRLAAEGARVIVADIVADRADAVAAEIGPNAAGKAFDAEDAGSIEAMVNFAVEKFGRLDILHNNAGYLGADLARDSTVTDIPMDLWDKTMAVNLRGYVLGARFAIPHMVRAGGGVVINTASGAAYLGDLSRVAYGTSKAAIIGLTKYIATQHAAQGIRCNAIAPGLIATPAFELSGAAFLEPFMRHILVGRLGKPDDIAAAVAYLASDEASYITGSVLDVDGGMGAHQPYVADFQALMAKAGDAAH